MFQQIYEPVGNLAVSTVIAAIPIVVLFVLLAGLRVAAQWAALITLAVALFIAVLVYQMPLGLALNSTLLGVCFGLFPIVWIVINAIVDTGNFDTIRNSLAGVSNDRRIQVVLLAFVFEGIVEFSQRPLSQSAGTEVVRIAGQYQPPSPPPSGRFVRFLLRAGIA